MTTLEDAWNWYRAVANSMKWLTRLAKHWGQFPWDRGEEWVRLVERDEVLKAVEVTHLTAAAGTVTPELDDLAVLVLFSVFEANVRDHLRGQLEPEVAGLRHPSLVKAGSDLLEDLSRGSFGRLLEPLKLEDKDKDLVERVNQVRRYRNWVAHGRRPEMNPGVVVRPLDAYERLTELLKLLQGFDPPAFPAAFP